MRSADIINTPLCLSLLNENEYTIIRHEEKMMAAMCMAFLVEFIYFNNPQKIFTHAPSTKP